MKTLSTHNINIDLDADPVVPEGWTVEEHRKGGQFTWDATKVALFLSKEQQNGKRIEGNKLRKELAEMPVFNANLLDYLLKHPHLIPEEWKGKYIFFWGTIYRGSSGGLGVRCLCWDGGSWRWGYDWLGDGWDGCGPAALRVSASDLESFEKPLETLPFELEINGLKYQRVRLRLKDKWLERI